MFIVLVCSLVSYGKFLLLFKKKDLIDLLRNRIYTVIVVAEFVQLSVKCLGSLGYKSLIKTFLHKIRLLTKVLTTATT